MNFYKECATILTHLQEKKGSIKSLVGTMPEKDRKRAAALVIETLKYQPVLLDVMQASGLQQQERKLLRDKNLAILLVHDLLFSKGIQAGDGPIKQAILKHKTRLNAELVKAQIKRGAGTKKDLAQTSSDAASVARRWVRINTLRASEEAVMRILRQDGFEEVAFSEIHESSEKVFWRDSYIPSLCSFAPSVQLQDSSLFLDGRIILQDKASCFPAFVLNPPSKTNAHVIDATAAPGNKTSHLSALMKGKGRVTAFERDKRRFQTLEMMLERAGASNVTPINQDFLSVNPLDPEYVNVSHILLDPSCSGSGIVNRLDYLLGQENDDSGSKESQERLEKLASFQIKMVLHAMQFPGLQRLVYSTCSIHEVENENVIDQALKRHSGTSKFRIAKKESVIPSWHRRGLHSNELDTNSFIRCLPEDGMNGFFVASLERQIAAVEPTTTLKRKAEEIDEDGGDDLLAVHEDASIASKRKKNKKKRKKQKTGGAEHPVVVSN